MTAGSVAFEAYRKTVQGVTYDGKPIPQWHELKRTIQLAWEAAAYAVRAHDMAVRDRKEIEERLAGLVRFLAWAAAAVAVQERVERLQDELGLTEEEA